MYEPALMSKPASTTARITDMFDSIAECLAVTGVSVQNCSFPHLVGIQQKQAAR